MILSHILLIFFLMLMGAFYFLAMTTSGLQFDIEMAKHYLPGKLQIERAEGNLFSTFTLKNISYQNQSQQIQIGTFSLTWKPEALLLKKWIIDSITVDQANVVIKQLPAVNKEKTSQTKKKKNPLSVLQNIRIYHINLNQVKLQLGNAEIDLSGKLEKNWDVNWYIRIPDLADFMAGSAGSLLTSGSITGEIFSPTINATLEGKKLLIADQQINQLNAKTKIIVKPKVNSTLNVSATGLKINDYPINQFDFNASGQVAFEKKTLVAKIKAVFAKQFPITATVSLPKFSRLDNPKQQVMATLDTSFTTLGWLTEFIPVIKKPEGLIKANAEVQGTFAHPEITSNINIINGRVTIPSVGITLRNMNVAGKSDLNNQLKFNGDLRSDKGSGQIQGVFDYGKPDYPLTLSIKGTNLTAVDLPEYHIVISPDVKLNYTQENLQLQGTILIPTAKITPKDFNSTITLPSDVVFVDSKKTVDTLPFTTALQLRLQLGDDIRVTYNNLRARLAGNLEITQTPGAIINAAGELYTKKGTYSAYGQKLKIKTGRLIYTGGSIMNPGLNISAVKEIKTVSTGGNVSSFAGTTDLKPVYTGPQTIVAGVQVAGTLDNPRITLFSNQNLSQADILSYMVFGYPQSQASGHEYGAILSALSSLNSSKTSMGSLTKKVKNTLGFSELNVESAQVFNPKTSTTSSATTVVIGKQLSPKLSMHYSVGLFDSVSILNLRYKLSKRWAIQSETSTMDNGADLLYSIERD